jgi:hypothetical protein
MDGVWLYRILKIIHEFGDFSLKKAIPKIVLVKAYSVFTLISYLLFIIQTKFKAKWVNSVEC